MSTECKCQDMVEIDALSVIELADRAAAGLAHQVAQNEPAIVAEWIAKINAEVEGYNTHWFNRLLRRKKVAIGNREELEAYLAKRHEEEVREQRNMFFPGDTCLEKYQNDFERLTGSQNTVFSITRAAETPGSKNLYLSIDTVKFLRCWAKVAPPQP